MNGWGGDGGGDSSLSGWHICRHIYIYMYRLISYHYHNMTTMPLNMSLNMDERRFARFQRQFDMFHFWTALQNNPIRSLVFLLTVSISESTHIMHFHLSLIFWSMISFWNIWWPQFLFRPVTVFYIAINKGAHNAFATKTINASSFPFSWLFCVQEWCYTWKQIVICDRWAIWMAIQ